MFAKPKPEMEESVSPQRTFFSPIIASTNSEGQFVPKDLAFPDMQPKEVTTFQTDGSVLAVLYSIGYWDIGS